MVSKIVNQKLKSTKQKWSVAPLGFCTYNLLLIASEKRKGEVDEAKIKSEYNEKSTLKIYCFHCCDGIWQ